MRMVALVTVVVSSTIAAVSAASGAASGEAKTGFELSRIGGSIQPFTLQIDTTGVVHASGAAPAHRTRLTKLQLAAINRSAFVNDFQTLPAVTACPGTLPDIAAQVIRVGARTVRVHGSCLLRFNRLWAALNRAVT